MKIKIALLSAIIFTCIFTTPGFALNTTISGNVNSQVVKTVRLLLYVNPILIRPDNYEVAVKKYGKFEISFNLIRPVYGTLIVNDQLIDIFVSPGRRSIINVTNIGVIFKEAMAVENRFLFSLKSDAGWDYSNYDLKLNPDSSYVLMKQKQNRIFSRFIAANRTSSFSPSFVDFFKAEDACRFNQFLIDFHLEYAENHHLTRDDRTFLNHYLKHIRYFINDDYLIAPAYLNNIIQYMRAAPEITTPQRLKHLSWQLAVDNFMSDTLTGKTKDYVMANEIYIDLKWKNQPDSLLISRFKTLANDSLAISTVEEFTRDYRIRSVLEHQPLPVELQNTGLTDSRGRNLTFKNLLALYRGKVLYINIWGYHCPGCRAEVPFTERLRQKYRQQPIAFINITPDDDKRINWSKYFAAAGTKLNHYQLKQGFKAPILTAFDIFWTPLYLLLDKDGKLASYNAPRPSQKDEIIPLIDGLLN